MYLLRSLSSKGEYMIVLNIGVFLVVVGAAFLGGFLLGKKKK